MNKPKSTVTKRRATKKSSSLAAHKKKAALRQKIENYRITEKQRTVLLLILLAIALSTLYFIQNNVESNFVDQL